MFQTVQLDISHFGSIKNVILAILVVQYVMENKENFVKYVKLQTICYRMNKYVLINALNLSMLKMLIEFVRLALIIVEYAEWLILELFAMNASKDSY